MANKLLKEINVDEILESFRANPQRNQELKVLWNGKKIEVNLEYRDFEKEINEIREKLENLKILVENAEEGNTFLKMLDTGGNHRQIMKMRICQD